MQDWERFIKDGAVSSVFQPIIHLSDGQIIGYEVLSRMSDIRGSFISLDHLLVAAEHLDMLSQLDMQLLTTSLDAILEREMDNTRYFINIFPVTLRLTEFHELLEGFVTKTKGRIPLVIEISEMIADPSLIQWSELLAPVRRLGIEVAIDDVGSGYAGLNRTVEMAPDWLKLDIGLVRGIDINAIKAAMVASIVTFTGRVSSIRVIAEGIETQSELDTLIELGIEIGQGYLMGKPGPNILQTRVVDLHRQMKVLDTEIDLSSFGMFLTEYLQKICLGYHNEQAMAMDACDYIERTLMVDHVEILSLNCEGQIASLAGMHGIEKRVLPEIPLSIFEKVLLGDIIVSQDTNGEDRPYSQMLNLKSSIKIPIFVTDTVYGFIFCGYKRPYQFRSEMVDVLKGIAAVLAVAMTNRNFSKRVTVR